MVSIEESKKELQNKGEFCCGTMRLQIKYFENKELNIYETPRSMIWYNRVERKYLIFHYSGNWNNITGITIDYCPFCGTKLPKELEDEDMEIILRKEYGWTDDDCWGHPRRDLPEEFKTDEWWKKRGL